MLLVASADMAQDCSMWQHIITALWHVGQRVVYKHEHDMNYGSKRIQLSLLLQWGTHTFLHLSDDTYTLTLKLHPGREGCCACNYIN